MSTNTNRRVVVIGNGMVGYKFCEKLVAKEKNEQRFTLTVFGEEPRVAYDRVHLSAYFDGKTADDLTLAPQSWYADNGITLYLTDPVVDIDRERKEVRSHHGVVVAYDYLVLATGSGAFVPAVAGVEKDGVFVYRTIEDLDLIQSYARKARPGSARKGAVLGGGLLGLEAAKALLDLGMDEAHVVEFAPRLMPRQIDAAGSGVLQRQLESLGLTIHLSKSTQEITGDEAITGMLFADGSRIDVDMLVISAGIRPRDELAKASGIETHPRGGILVDNFLQTSDPAIFAIGECAVAHHMIYGLVAPGNEMADVVASRLMGHEKEFKPYDMSTKLKLIGTDVGSFGEPFAGESDGCTSIVYENKAKGVYKRINISADGKELLGGILVGDAEQYNMLLQTCKNKTVLPPNPEDLILGSRGGEEAGAGVMSLPDDALICSCEAVTKAMLCHEIGENGHNTVDALKKATKACTGCGGCTPMVKDIIQGVMKQKGVYVRNILCEHFDFTRQELLDLVKINSLKTFDAVIDQVGHGDGCEVCKPAVASILASLWNENILEKGRATIQDSNDRYLANIQKGGTYSVVPRIPGGEITPDKLIVIGQVAKKYGLYTKITGGQRIDLFGAHVGDLPIIWEELIAAGFESGHAYGKSLRTVKSCVGSTWCRFGVQDSVSFAIEVEERYKGIRSPHKIKSGVSGCIRECAEAQSKDFGIIATEKGWNLYIGGNGGSKPQHAQLLASDVDKETCIRYIDRFLMFYIKTADPLTRTATWLNKLEGGMTYLRAVIIDDVLGITSDLEREMQLLVDTFKCEWKEVVDSPALRARFSHFVNMPEQKDPTVQFDALRDQKRAKEWA
ncbi:nitrite reductase large subunit NirB [Spirosoma utsteinense]|uniref:Nitrite reductase (NADH) large subunit n=1 Tax=Spirosoma utsteinense TaxID=2585773 RepID=A0ABR6VZ05_9BACT|nr:nitrite reductase large subunit NirB [Spirosoma utsteinense]MBC3784714.1 nitrite reductase (NADH) large subunit [Spirosoma utsteinense]MBC3789532.1 nitrite reductase (NADH) large subunit [Spirosoma utsteinense]